MFRFFVLNAFIAIHSIVFCLWGLLISLIDGNGRKVHFFSAVPWAKIALWVCGVRVEVRGLKHVNAGVPRIYLTNHQSYFDIFALLACLPVNFKFILKQELMRIPLLGWTMRSAGYIGIEREDPRKAVQGMNQAAERLKNGASLVIFPEGTRSTDGRLLPFKKGGFKLALKSGCDIVPVAINNSYRIVPKGSLSINKGLVHISIGKTISLKNYNRQNIEQLMNQVKQSMLQQMGNHGTADESGPFNHHKTDFAQKG